MDADRDIVLRTVKPVVTLDRDGIRRERKYYTRGKLVGIMRVQKFCIGKDNKCETLVKGHSKCSKCASLDVHAWRINPEEAHGHHTVLKSPYFSGKFVFSNEQIKEIENYISPKILEPVPVKENLEKPITYDDVMRVIKFINE